MLSFENPIEISDFSNLLNSQMRFLSPKNFLGHDFVDKKWAFFDFYNVLALILSDICVTINVSWLSRSLIMDFWVFYKVAFYYFTNQQHASE